ncbi:hypothetical protein ACFLRP_01265 [Bacteroidota bacterium]
MVKEKAYYWGSQALNMEEPGNSEKRELRLLLMFGPANLIVGIEILSRNVACGIIVILAASLITILASYNQWVYPKKRRWLWVTFPGLLSVFGYFPLMRLREK